MRLKPLPLNQHPPSRWISHPWRRLLPALLTLLLGVTWLTIAPPRAEASAPRPLAELDDPQAISLSYFRASGQSDGVRLEWGTETEFDTAGFFIRRSSTQGGSFTDPGIGFVPAAGGELDGADYTVSDTSAIPGQSYWYQLVELETNGTEHTFGPINALAGATPTPTAVVIVQPTAGGSTPIPTSTSIATSTPAPTATFNTPTVPPTRTGTPTVTPIPLPTGTATRTPFPVTNNPTVTAFAFPTATGGGGQPGVVEAAQQTSPDQGGYPGPATAYPEPFGPTQVAPIAYPAASEDAPTLPAFPTTSEQPTTASGAGTSSENLAPLAASDAAQTDSAAATQGRILLWVGFALALAIFGIGVYVAIVLFNRRPPGQS